MDAQQFLAEFGHIANAPGGVARLRELVLHLAITGKLVPQNESDLDAHKLIEQMRSHVSNNSFKKRTTSKKKTIIQQHIFESKIPSNWVVADLGELGDWGAGSTPSRSNSIYYGGTIPWFKSGELKDDLISVAEEHVSDLALKECSLRLNSPGDVLIAMYGANIGQTSIIEVESTTNQAVCACTPYKGLSNRFLLITLKALKRFFIGLGAGGAQPNISKEKIIATRIGLPPLEEQSRIVAKVDELMALCDQLEAQQQQRRTLQNHLRQATLQAVATSQSPHELKESWQRLEANFGQLFSAPADVGSLRDLILDLAANGYLSEPKEGDGDFQDCLDQASRLQNKEFSVKELREIKALPNPVVENGRLRIALGRVIKLVSGQHLGPDEYNSNKNGIPYITGPAEFSEGRPSPTKWTLVKKSVALYGDILITVKGSGVGKTAICDLKELAISRQLMAIRAVAGIDKNYLAICVDSAERKFQEQKFGIAIPGIGREEVLSLSIVLPSIEEQKRIVSRVIELTRLCDELEKSLKRATAFATKLATASVSTLTGITIEQEEEPMKAPQTELVAPVRLGTSPDVKAQAPLATILARHNGEMSAKDLWQRFGGEIDAFYAQLKTEVAHGWLLEPEVAEMREKAES